MSGQLRAIVVPKDKVGAKVAEIQTMTTFKVLAVDNDGYGFAPQGFSVIVFGRPADIQQALTA
ncbi:MAG: hypothetical protein OJI70_12955 [Zavarzinia sp.]|nr:hypothetical protein [Zavarzinia sp.]